MINSVAENHTVRHYSTLMNVTRAVVNTVSSSRKIHPYAEKIPVFVKQKFTNFSPSPAATADGLFHLRDIPFEDRDGDEDFELLMLDG